MGREAKPLIVRFLPAMEGRVEVLTAESRLAHSGSPGPVVVEDEQEQLLTMLVMFDTQPADRWSARALAGSFIAAECVFEQSPTPCDLGDWFIALMNAREPSSACTIVLVLPDDYSAEVAHHVGDFLHRLRETARHEVALVAAVAANTSGWADCPGIDGFVSAEPGNANLVGLQVFDMFSALMAPGMVSCMDIEDFRLALGSPKAPSQVCQGAWVSADLTLSLSKACRAMLAKSEIVACMMATMSFAAVRQLVREIRACASKADILILIPYGLTAVLPSSDTMTPVRLLYRGGD